jgi:hypothetical protein
MINANSTMGFAVTGGGPVGECGVSLEHMVLGSSDDLEKWDSVKYQVIPALNVVVQVLSAVIRCHTSKGYPQS